MMHNEFEALAGYEVSFEDYTNIIEPMYMATNLSKEEFVKCIDKKRFALKPIHAIEKEMKQIAKQLKETCTHFHDYEAEERLYKLMDEYMERKGLKDIAGYTIESEQIWSCYYPKKIVIYSKKDYRTFEEMNIA